MSSNCHYESLGIPRNASQEDIKKAYRKLAKMYHPDRNKNPGADEQFKKIGKAYEILMDPCTRLRYDKELMESQFEHIYTATPSASDFYEGEAGLGRYNPNRWNENVFTCYSQNSAPQGRFFNSTNNFLPNPFLGPTNHLTSFPFPGFGNILNMQNEMLHTFGNMLSMQSEMLNVADQVLHSQLHMMNSFMNCPDPVGGLHSMFMVPTVLNPNPFSEMAFSVPFNSLAPNMLFHF